VSTRSQVVAIGGALLIAASSVSGVLASSHREAPLISGDPAADNTDLYAFVSPDDPSKLTIIANYIPLQQPGGGPNFHPFDDDVRYRIHIDNTGDAKDDVTYNVTFKTNQASGKNGVSSFLYNNLPIASVNSASWLVPQEFTVERTTSGADPVKLGENLRTVPANIGPRSTPDYAAIAASGIHGLTNGGKAYAGPRDDAFFVDLGSIFDLGGLRPFNTVHLLPLGAEDGVDGVAGYNTASIVLQVPISEVTSASGPVVGVWASAERKASKTISSDGKVKWSGPWIQVSRLGNPLINEVIIPRHLKDYWNAQSPARDSQFLQYYEAPELAALENFLYGAPDAPTGHPGGALEEIDQTGRTDLSLILLKGVPGVNAIGSNPVAADMLRVNTAIAPCTADRADDDAGECRRMAVLDGDVAGFPNGRRLTDDVTDIELRAVAQGYGTFLNTPPPAGFGLPNKFPNNIVGDGVDTNADMPFLASFPYIGLPHSGYESVPIRAIRMPM